MTKQQIRTYWEERIKTTLEFHKACKQKHREKLPAKISRRIKRDAFQPKKPGKNLEMFLPKPEDLERKVRLRQQEAEIYLDKLIWKQRQEDVKELLRILDDNEDYDFRVQSEYNLGVEYWLEQAKEATGDGSRYEENLHDLQERLTCALSAKKKGYYMPEAFIEHLKQKIRYTKKAMYLKKSHNNRTAHRPKPA